MSEEKRISFTLKEFIIFLLLIGLIVFNLIVFIQLNMAQKVEANSINIQRLVQAVNMMQTKQVKPQPMEKSKEEK